MSRTTSNLLKITGGVAMSLAVLLSAEASPVAAAGHRDAEIARGDAAIEQIGDRLDKLARKTGLSSRVLAELIREDVTVRVDPHGHVFFEDAAPRSWKRKGAGLDWNVNPPYATSDTFLLHSRKSAPLKIYLDFTGHTTSGTWWNTYETGGRTFTTPAFDLDGNRGSFSAAEHALIQSVWQSVREDFATFNVDVTTEDPGLDALTYSGEGDTTWGTRVVIGPNTWYGSPAGGVGYLGSFGNAVDTPVYVFAGPNAGAKFVAEAASHEVGHSLNLLHDGTTAGEEYYGGHGDWAPIMGVGYSRPITQWSAGEYAGANNLQDDLAILGQYLGWLADDVANGTSTTATLPAGTRRYGTVNRAGDSDVYKFSITRGGTVLISAWNNTGDVDANLDIRLVLRDGNGRQVAVSSPAGSQGATMKVTLPAGTYYAYVSGIGTGAPATSGYSAYSSIGFYGIVLTWA